MKFIIISLLLLGVMLGLCLYTSSQVIDAVQNTSALLEEAITAEKSGNKELALQMVRAARDEWHNHETFFGTVLRHDEIDDITEEFARLESYASTEDQDDFRSNCAALLSSLTHIDHMERTTFENIM